MVSSPVRSILVPDPEQTLVLDHGSGALLVTGAAGTGKTAALRERFARLIEAGNDPERVALVVGSKRARNEARVELLERMRRSMPTLRVLTIHGLAYHVVDERNALLDYDAPPAILSADDQFATVHDLLAGEDPADWPAYGGMLRLRGFADEVRQFLLRAQESRLRPEDIESRATSRGLTGWLELAAFFRRYLQVLDGQRQVDFAGLVEQAAAAAERGEPMFDHVMIDDIQDSTIGAEALLARLRPGSLVAAGNLGAHIFSFQGFTDLTMRRFTTTFRAGALELTTPHRSATIERTAWTTPHSSEEYACLARELRRIHIEEDVPWGELAVVVRRQGAHLAGLLRALDDAAVPRVAADGGHSLLLEPATVPYILALRWLARPQDRDSLVETLLTSELARCSPAEGRMLVRAAKAAGKSAAGALSFPEALPVDRSEAVTTLHDVLTRAERVADASVADAFAILWRELPSSARLVHEATGGSVEAAADVDAVLCLARAVEAAGERGDSSAAAFLASLEAGDEGPGMAADDSGALGAVRVLTAHATAGREFDTVLVAGVIEGNFPSLSRPEAMFDLAILEGPLPQSERNRRRLEDERRLFDLITSRARRRIVLTSSDERDADAVITTRSRFVDDLATTWRPAPVGPFDDPLTVTEASATWRRTLADHAAPGGRRLSALDGLLALGVDPGRWWYQREWTDTGRPLREGIRVSASRLDTLDNCELQFVLGEELGLDTSTSYYAWVGHTVHRIIEDCERGDIERDLASLVATAEDRWRPERFPSLAVSEQFRALVTTRMLPAWFEEYGAQPALAAEERFEFELDGATVAGVIDRIGRVEPEGSQITDYKTGKKRRGKADDILQLGVYYLAVQESENLRPYLPVRAIELAFVRDVEFHEGGMARQTKGFTRDDEAEYEGRMRATLSELIARVRALYETEVIRPNPGANCRFCTFQPLCPLFPEGSDPFPWHAAQEVGA
jgi:superfamily I DNA/RNA helicase/RecB family exonuclease